ncbi:MarR family winged helix-turn-helix transcriptional regulator [Marinobacterium arenosum]|uniref:MarR family winged helix-turn-helix transcriptional regulator n=1 Tax=Marinobacterium arenosum TaxID=2862496 RepID=UPI001C981842|nr:MarR family transcriptional regulator [Marinobacterium arenosum]MBY4677606.1 MarR family transcriptional regulator [Marinobacterium arenosum]
MSKSSAELCDDVLVSLRRIIRAVDLHSRRLATQYGLTGPQTMLLKAIIESPGMPAGELARRVSLSQATITDILKRLEQRELVRRERSDSDRRKVFVFATDKAMAVIESAPPLLQEKFVERFSHLRDWEQMQLLASLQRVAELMDAETIDAAPLLVSGQLGETADVKK